MSSIISKHRSDSIHNIFSKQISINSVIRNNITHKTALNKRPNIHMRVNLRNIIRRVNRIIENPQISFIEIVNVQANKLKMHFGIILQSLR